MAAGTRPRVPAIYERLGVTPVVNGAATLTRLGGSLMPPPVIEAMAQAASAFVPLDELQRAAGKRIAELTRNEAAYVTSGAAAGLVLATAACITGADAEKMALLPRPEKIPGGKHKVVVFRSGGALSLEKTVELAHQHGVPVVVDAAAQIPPVENLWRFSGAPGPALWAQAQARLGIEGAVTPAPAQTTPLGADLALFSGGKGLCGPQPSGLMLGRGDLIDAIARQSNPNPMIGRPMKVGKEEICGLVAAVEWYLGQDFDALAADYERQVRVVLETLGGVPGVRATRDWPNEAGQPLARVRVQLLPESRLTRDALQAALRAHRPPIELSEGGSDAVYVNPQTLQPGEAELTADALRRILTSA